MEELFNQLKLERISSLKRDDVLLVKRTDSSDDKLYCLKFHAAKHEQIIYKDCFPKINKHSLHRIKLPEAIKIGSLFSNDGLWVLMEDYGRDIIPWSETNEDTAGGKNITPDYADILIEMLQDLKTIDIGLFKNIIPNVDNCPWYLNLLNKARELINSGLMPADELPRISKMLTRGISEEQKINYILTNGDFQFRNFIKQPDDKIVVIDWTGDSYNTPNIEPIEFPIMYQWTLMWGNPTWQDLYVKKVMKTFKINLERLVFALVVKSINQAHLWRSGDLAKIQTEHCIRALNGKIISSNIVA